MARKPAARSSQRDTPLLEWIAASLGGLLAAAVLGVVLWHGAFGRDTPADIDLKAKRVGPGSGGIQVDITATNRGNHTASEVRVEGRVGQETGTAVFDFIPGGAHRDGTLVFRSAPPDGRVELRVLGYREP